MYSSVLNIRSSSTAPGTITITNSATFTHSPNLSRAPKRVASPQNSLAERGACCSVLNTHANWVCNLGSTACLRAELLCSLHSYFFNHAAALSLWLLLILWAAMACFLHWNVAGQMLQQAWYRFLSSTPPSLSQSLRWGCPSGAGCSSHSAWNLFVGPWAPKYFPSLFPLATLAFYGGSFPLIQHD